MNLTDGDKLTIY